MLRRFVHWYLSLHRDCRTCKKSYHMAKNRDGFSNVKYFEIACPYFLEAIKQRGLEGKRILTWTPGLEAPEIMSDCGKQVWKMEHCDGYEKQPYQS